MTNLAAQIERIAKKVTKEFYLERAELMQKLVELQWEFNLQQFVTTIDQALSGRAKMLNIFQNHISKLSDINIGEIQKEFRSPSSNFSYIKNTHDFVSFLSFAGSNNYSVSLIDPLTLASQIEWFSGYLVRSNPHALISLNQLIAVHRNILTRKDVELLKNRSSFLKIYNKFNSVAKIGIDDHQITKRHLLIDFSMKHPSLSMHLIPPYSENTPIDIFDDDFELESEFERFGSAENFPQTNHGRMQTFFGNWLEIFAKEKQIFLYKTKPPLPDGSAPKGQWYVSTSSPNPEYYTSD